MSVDVEVVGKSDEELLKLGLSDPKSLNLEEILHAATLTNDLNQKATIYKAATEKFPQCSGLRITSVMFMFNLARLLMPRMLSKLPRQLMDNAAVKANLGAVALAQGDLKTAEELLTSAMSAGDAVSYNLGIIKIKQGDYAAAVNYFGNKPSFNAALAQLLNGSNDKAIATLNELGDVKDGWVYYLKASCKCKWW